MEIDTDVVFDDGVAYERGWQPLYTFTLDAGEGLVFPPGWLHETVNQNILTSDKNHEGTCTVALTTQFEHPGVGGYYRNFIQRLRRVGDLAQCWHTFNSWASVSPSGTPEAPDVKFARLDANRDGALTLLELIKAFDGDEAFAYGILGFHDRDEDGYVRKDEFATNIFSAKI